MSSGPTLPVFVMSVAAIPQFDLDKSQYAAEIKDDPMIKDSTWCQKVVVDVSSKFELTSRVSEGMLKRKLMIIVWILVLYKPRRGPKAR